MLKVLSLGAGIQSTALYHMIDYDAVFFADTGNEPKNVMKHVENLQIDAKRRKIPFFVVKEKSGLSLEQSIRSGRYKFVPIPVFIVAEDGSKSMLRRQCTNQFKVAPVNLAVRQWLQSLSMATARNDGQVRVNKSVKIEMHFGISADEAHRQAPSRTGWQVNRYPLVENNYTREDCIAWLTETGFEVPPKSSCIFCPFHTNDYWLGLDPDELESAFELDEHLRSEGVRTSRKGKMYLHAECKPLRELWESGRLAAKPKQLTLGFRREALDGCRSEGFSCFS
jgi:hypothetical protein